MMSGVMCQVRLPRQRYPLSLLSRLMGKPHSAGGAVQAPLR